MDFGPISTFWLFSFERFNGVLGDEPTNNRSIEIQMMNRFVNDNSHMQLFSVLQRHSVGDTPFCRDVMTHVLGQFTSTRHLDQYDTSSHFGPRVYFRQEIYCLDMHQIETVRSLYS